MITQKELKEILHYDPSTGIFTRKITTGRRGRWKEGTIAGTIVKQGYIHIGVDGKSYKAHRLAWLYVHGVWPDQIDHVNHIRTDNRILNLRNVSQKENSKNNSRSKRNTSGVTGVKWHKRDEKWMAVISVNKKHINLGGFVDFFEAVCSRMSANNKYNFHENHGR